MSRYICPECGLVYDEAVGIPREGFPPGTPFSEVPDDWSCPDCGVLIGVIVDVPLTETVCLTCDQACFGSESS